GVYKSGDKFVVAIYRQDGSAAFALVEPTKSTSGKSASRPDMSDLMKTGRVIYTVHVPGTEGAAKAIGAPEPADKLGNGIPLAKLTRKQRSDVVKQYTLTADVLDTIG